MPKVVWTADNDRKLLIHLIEKSAKAYDSVWLAKLFKSESYTATPKAIEERIAKLKREAKSIRGEPTTHSSKHNKPGPKKKKRDAADAGITYSTKSSASPPQTSVCTADDYTNQDDEESSPKLKRVKMEPGLDNIDPDETEVEDNVDDLPDNKLALMKTLAPDQLMPAEQVGTPEQLPVSDAVAIKMDEDTTTTFDLPGGEIAQEAEVDEGLEMGMPGSMNEDEAMKMPSFEMPAEEVDNSMALTVTEENEGVLSSVSQTGEGTPDAPQLMSGAATPLESAAFEDTSMAAGVDEAMQTTGTVNELEAETTPPVESTDTITMPNTTEDVEMSVPMDISTPKEPEEVTEASTQDPSMTESAQLTENALPTETPAILETPGAAEDVNMSITSAMSPDAPAELACATEAAAQPDSDTMVPGAKEPTDVADSTMGEAAGLPGMEEQAEDKTEDETAAHADEEVADGEVTGGDIVHEEAADGEMSGGEAVAAEAEKLDVEVGLE